MMECLPIEVYTKVMNFLKVEECERLQYVSKAFRDGVLYYVGNVLYEKTGNYPNFVFALAKNVLKRNIYKMENHIFFKTEEGEIHKNIFQHIQYYTTPKFTEFLKGYDIEFEKVLTSSVFTKGVSRAENNLDKVELVKEVEKKNLLTGEIELVRMINTRDIISSYAANHTIFECKECASFLRMKNGDYFLNNLTFVPFETLARSATVPIFEKECCRGHTVYKREIPKSVGVSFSLFP